MSPRFARRFRLSLNRRFFPCTERMHSGGRRRFIVNTLAAMKKSEKVENFGFNDAKRAGQSFLSDVYPTAAFSNPCYQ